MGLCNKCSGLRLGVHRRLTASTLRRRRSRKSVEREGQQGAAQAAGGQRWDEQRFGRVVDQRQGRAGREIFLGMSRREGLNVRSVFDYPEVQERLVKTGILNAEQSVRLLKESLNLVTNSPLPPAELQDLNTFDWERVCPSLPAKAYAALKADNFRICTLTVQKSETNHRGDVVKVLYSLPDGKEIESCVMRFGTDAKPQGEEGKRRTQSRSTVCVSSQIGCKMACTFCATGTMGLIGNLTCGEILEQVVMANRLEREFRQGADDSVWSNIGKDGKWLRNVVFMGMGEPLDNYEEVRPAIQLLIDQKFFALAGSRVTLSTVGSNMDRIRQLKDDLPRLSLALSLHAPNQKLRESIVPTARASKLEELMKVSFEYVENQQKFSKSMSKRHVLFIEYCMIEDVNDSPDYARQLALLLSEHKETSAVNLIPYNPTDVPGDFKTPSLEAIDAFVQELRHSGIRVFVRHEFGTDISGACGQLAVRSKADSTSSMSEVSSSSGDEEDVDPEDAPTPKEFGLAPPALVELAETKGSDKAEAEPAPDTTSGPASAPRSRAADPLTDTNVFVSIMPTPRAEISPPPVAVTPPAENPPVCVAASNADEVDLEQSGDPDQPEPQVATTPASETEPEKPSRKARELEPPDELADAEPEPWWRRRLPRCTRDLSTTELAVWGTAATLGVLAVTMMCRPGRK